jgi:hypothetical protein
MQESHGNGLVLDACATKPSSNRYSLEETRTGHV